MPRGIVTSRLRPSTVIRRCPPCSTSSSVSGNSPSTSLPGIGMRTPARPPDGRPKIDPKKSLKSSTPSHSVLTLGPRPVSGGGVKSKPPAAPHLAHARARRDLGVGRHRGHGLVEVGIERSPDALEGLGPRLAQGGEEEAVRRGYALVEIAVRRAGRERPLERVQHGQQREQRRAAALAPRGLVLLRGPTAVVVKLREQPEMPIVGFGGALTHAFLSSASLNSASMTSPSCPPPAPPCGPAPGSGGPPRAAASASICA